MSIKNGARLRVLVSLGLLGVLVGSLVVGCGKSSPSTTSPQSTSKATSSAPASSTTTTTKPATTSAATTAKPTTTSAPPTSSANRQQQLEAAAQKEGKITFWTSFGTLADTYLAPFKKKYPWLQVEVWQATNEPIGQKFMAEAQVGTHTADVLGLSEEVALAIPASLYGKYEWPNTTDWPATSKQKDGLYLRSHMNPMGPTFNTNLAGANPPKKWDDLKNPAWKGKAVAATDSEEAPLMTALIWGQPGQPAWDKSFAYWQELFTTLQPKTTTGYTPPTKLLGAGEYYLFVYDSGAVALREMMTSKLPIALLPDVIPAKPSVLALPKDTPHPNAARLFLDYMTSPEGATLFSNTMYSISMSPSAANSEPNKVISEKGIKLFVVTADQMSKENMKKSGDFWRKLLGL
ncbi:MAG: extracellular solute-binding protein [Chloroflexi bacterium]|nr:extracellular solute-binding protein [Chloroflexota bacterium]